jgi:hypothetical protein
VMYSDPRATACTSCGDGIFSEARDIDENPLAPNGTLVMATSSSCCESHLLLLLLLLWGLLCWMLCWCLLALCLIL